MTAQKLYETLKFLDALDNKLGLQNNLGSIKDTLNNLVKAPAEPQHQSSLADALGKFTTAAAKLVGSITPSQDALIEAMGGKEFFDHSIAEKINGSISTNAMTPSVARDFVQDFHSRRATFLTTVRNTRQGLEKIGISEAKLAPGSADMAFLIPRELFKNHLEEFAKELKFIDRLISDFSEAITGKPESVELQELSSSDPTVALIASVFVIEKIAIIVNKFLEAWERIRKIRNISGELTEMGIKGKAVEELTEQITTTVDEVVEESTEIVLENYKENVANRKNELGNALRQDMHRLFGQIERGLTVEFRAEPKDAGADQANKKALETLVDLSRKIQFPLIANEPMLLASGEILEGNLKSVKVSKKTTKRKITITKEPPEEAKRE